MSVIVVANPKGGVGKSTLATQISGYLASLGKAVTLGDLDRQQSSRGRPRAPRTRSSTPPQACTATGSTPR
jgi:cellulose biosynthesis protein BcsQ